VVPRRRSFLFIANRISGRPGCNAGFLGIGLQALDLGVLDVGE